MDFTRIQEVLGQVADAIEQGIVNSEKNHAKGIQTMEQMLAFIDDFSEFLAERSEAQPRHRAAGGSSVEEMFSYLLNNSSPAAKATFENYRDILLSNTKLLKGFYDATLHKNFQKSWESATDNPEPDKGDNA